MTPKKLILSALILIVLGLGLHAQTVIPATGGSASGSAGTVSYSIGQVVYTTNTGANGSVAQGVQQPYEISYVSGIDEAQVISLAVSAYPNPTSDFILLDVEVAASINVKTMSYQIFDLQGKLLEMKKLEGNQTSIEMINYVPATYFLKVIAGNKEIMIFKVIKN